MFLYPYRKGSKSANSLSHAAGMKQIKLNNSRFVGSPNKTVINWGRTVISEEVEKCSVVNEPEAVGVASNKLHFFRGIRDWNIGNMNRAVVTPSFSDTVQGALDIIRLGHTVVARQVLNGHSGAGIVLCDSQEKVEATPAELYVWYVPKSLECRVHVMNGEVIDIQRKARRPDIADADVNWKVRNHKNGFIYVRDEDNGGFNIPDSARCMAITAVEAVGLDFGAVDMIYNKKDNWWYVLEVNTAPGLTGKTLENYVAAIQKFYGD